MEVIQNGVKWIQLRDKTSSRHQIYKIARMLKSIAIANNVTLIINDHVDVALAIDADGVHLGQDDMSITDARKIIGNKIIGISTHNYQQALEAQRQGADYIGFGPIFNSITKDAGTPLGINSIKELRFPKDGNPPIYIPITAIGGITQDSIIDIFNVGASAVAVSAGITSTNNVSKTAGEFVGIVNEYFGISNETVDNSDIEGNLASIFSNQTIDTTFNNNYQNTPKWQTAMELAVICNTLASVFPASAPRSLCSEIERIAISIPVTIAKGIIPANELNPIINEIETLITIANRLNLIHDEKLEIIMGLCGRLRMEIFQ
jgi:thiamine-phosphate pyrophosphorylase